MSFLDTIGKKITKADQLKVGDIVARCIRTEPYTYDDDVYLYCVKRVLLEWQPKTFIWPAVYMKAPSIGMRVKDNHPFYWHVHSPCLGHVFEHQWYPEDTMSALDEETKGLLEYKPYDLYHVADEDYVALGNLINQIEIPWWSFLCQNRYSKANIFNFVADIQEDLQKGKEAYESIQNKVRRWDVHR